MKIDYESMGRIQWVSWVKFCESNLGLVRKTHIMIALRLFLSGVCSVLQCFVNLKLNQGDMHVHSFQIL